MNYSRDQLKQQAADAAAAGIADGMAVGLGSGSTAEFFIQALAARVQGGLHIVGVPSSLRSESLARELGIPLGTLDTHPRLDVTVDGADEVDLSNFAVIKGLGGALLREKLVAAATALEIIIVDERKLVPALGQGLVPVEVIPFGWRSTAARLIALGATPQLRTTLPPGETESDPDPAAHAYVTDGGNFILDCRWPAIPDPAALAAAVKGVTGVVEHGLFIGLVGRVIVAGANGVQTYDHPAR